MKFLGLRTANLSALILVSVGSVTIATAAEQDVTTRFKEVAAGMKKCRLILEQEKRLQCYDTLASDTDIKLSLFPLKDESKAEQAPSAGSSLEDLLKPSATPTAR